MLQTLALTHQTNSITQTKKIIMKHSLRYSLLLLLSMVFSLSSQAQTLIDGIYYNLDTETNTASVTRNSNGSGYSREIIIPSSVESEGIEYSVTSIGFKAFYYCTSLTSIEIPSSVTSIGDYAFAYCTSLTSIEIPSSITRIYDYAFEGCTSLTSVEIPSSVTSIGGWAFEDCTSLTSVVCEAVTPPTCENRWVFYRVPMESATLYVPEASAEAYRTTSPWSTFGSILPLSNFDTKIDAVEETVGRGASAHVVYSLSGQRTVQPDRGIYITNGKVFIAK